MDEIWRTHFRTTATESVFMETPMNLALSVINGMGLQSIPHDNPDTYKSLRDQWAKILTLPVRTNSP